MAFLKKSDIINLEDKIESLERKQHKASIQILAEIDRSSTSILVALFSESRQLREAIGHQQVILKSLEDNVQHLEFFTENPVTSKIEVTVGADVFGCGVKWVLDVDINKAGYAEVLEALSQAPGISDGIKRRIAKKAAKLLSKP